MLWLEATKSDTSVGIAAPLVPDIGLREISVRVLDLRGLSKADDFDAFRRMFARKLLTTSDIRHFGNQMWALLVIAALYALGQESAKRALEIGKLLDNVSDQDLAIYCMDLCVLGSIKWGQNELQRHREALTEWVDAFPGWRGRVSIFLAGAIVERAMRARMLRANPNAIHHLALLLWEWREEPVDDEWLCKSSKGGLHGGPDSETFDIDILQASHNWFKKWGPGECGITGGQHADLLNWFDRLLVRRRELTQ
jgi:hypothetical protein